MCLTDGFLKDCVHNLRICDVFAGVPYKWNEKQQRLEMKSNTQLKIYNVRLFISYLYLALAIVQVVWSWEEASNTVITHNVMFIADYVLNASCHLLNFMEPKGIIALFNSMIEFEERRSKKKCHKLPKQEKGGRTTKYLMQMMAATGIFMPILYHIDILRNPCFPMYVGYWLSDQCQTELGVPSPASWSLAATGTKILISLVSYLNWSFLLTGYCFHISVELVLQGHCFRTYIEKYGSEVMKILKVSAGTRKNTLAFRELQVMSTQYRCIYSKYLIQTIAVCIMIIQIICLYSSVMLAKDIKTGLEHLGLNLLYFWCTFVCAFIIIFLFGILADVYRISNKVKKGMDGKRELKQDKWFVKFLKTYPALRIYIGGSNFLDELTPLSLQNFVINQTVSLLLLN